MALQAYRHNYVILYELHDHAFPATGIVGRLGGAGLGTFSRVRGYKPKGKGTHVYADSFKERSKLKTLSDEELILQVQAGNNVCFDLLVDRFKVRLFNYLFRMVGDRDELRRSRRRLLSKPISTPTNTKPLRSFRHGCTRSRPTW